LARTPHGNILWDCVPLLYVFVPNYIPLPPVAVERIIQAVEPFEYERVYGAFWDTVVERNGKEAVRQSAERYLRAIKGDD
jgi:hypothetical protein